MDVRHEANKRARAACFRTLRERVVASNAPVGSATLSDMADCANDPPCVRIEPVGTSSSYVWSN